MKDGFRRHLRFSKRKLRALIGAILPAVLVASIWPPNEPLLLAEPFRQAEKLGYAFMFRARGADEGKFDPNLVVVGFDRESERNLGVQWPPPRRFHAQVIRNLTSDGARMIVIDVLFSGPTTSQDDKDLDQALKAARAVVITQRLDRDMVEKRKSIEAPHYDDALGVDFESAAIPGLAEVVQDTDGIVRAFIPAINHQDEWLPTLATAAYLKLNNLTQSDIRIDREGFSIGTLRIAGLASYGEDPVDGSSLVTALVDFPVPVSAMHPQQSKSQFKGVDFDDVYAGNFPKGMFRNRIVVIGVTGPEIARGMQDIYATAATQIEPDAGSSMEYNRIPGVYVQTYFLNALLTNSFLSWSSTLAAASLTFFASAISIFGVIRYLNWRGPMLVGFVVASMIAASYISFDQLGVYLPFVLPSVLTLISAGCVAWIERSALKKRWEGYVSPVVLEQILRSESDTMAERVEATVMFGDVRGFTSFSDSYDADTVIRVLNAHFERLTNVVLQEGGTIDKFLGDGIMVIWGAPIRHSEAAFKAVRAALVMRDMSMEPIEHGTDQHVLLTGFGLATGPFVAGHVGARRRHDYTVIGDVVNVAARLQGVTGQADVVIDEATFLQLRDRFECESLGSLELKGKSRGVVAYRVIKEIAVNSVKN